MTLQEHIIMIIRIFLRLNEYKGPSQLHPIYFDTQRSVTLEMRRISDERMGLGFDKPLTDLFTRP